MMIRRFFDQAYLYHKGRSAAFEAEEFVLMEIAYPLITMIFYCLVATFSFGTTDLTGWVIGNAFLLCTNACIFGVGIMFVKERQYGRMRSIIAAPCSKLSLILASGVFPTLFAVLASVCGLVVGKFVFGVSFASVDMHLVAITIVVAMVSATCFGLFISAFGLMNDSMHLVLNIVSYLLMIFTGAEFPIKQLPMAGQVIAQMMPLTKAIAAMNKLYEGNKKDFAVLIMAEIFTGAVYALLTYVVFEFAEKSAQRNGKFDMF
jgi:ABC-2 type transport system permease protein